jgi:hypothetical protein
MKFPCDGLVKFELVGIRSAAHFTVKILEFLPARENRWISCELKMKKIEEALNTLQNSMEVEMAMIQVAVKSGDVCAVFYPKMAK